MLCSPSEMRAIPRFPTKPAPYRCAPLPRHIFDGANKFSCVVASLRQIAVKAKAVTHDAHLDENAWPAIRVPRHKWK